MDASFWHERWAKNEIAFHGSAPNPLLLKHFPRLSLQGGTRVFVPLCGKTLDIGWLLSEGYRVVGAELSEAAIVQLFADLGVAPEVSSLASLKHYRGPDLDIFVGNVFEVSRDILGPVDAVYDRAALVALPEEMRQRYTAHLMEITGTAPQLLLAFEYDQSQLEGPPFSIPDAFVERYYQDHYQLTKLDHVEVPGGIRGECPAQENVWLLERA